jgi:leucyl-tRNA synthetase
MFDWDHTVDTTTPEYYRWTQWLFLQLYKGGMAERKEAPVNWCPSCMTVLANEQVQGGHCERCDSAVEQRRIAQWFFRISKFAPRLLENLATLDWSETTKKAQENWIGRSEGAILRFADADADADANGADRAPEPRPRVPPGAGRAARRAPPKSASSRSSPPAPTRSSAPPGWCSRPSTPWWTISRPPEQRAEVDAYRATAAKMDLVARKKTDKTKTGVFTGGHCVNPATGEPIPVWISDYVLMEYGTGAIMAVPGHDERDFEFATPSASRFRGSWPARGRMPHPAHRGVDRGGRLVNSGRFDGLEVDEAKRAVTEWLAEKGAGELTVNYRLHDWCISRQRYWGPPIPIVYCDACGAVPVPENQLPVVLPRVEDFRPDDSGVSPLARVAEWYETTCPDCGGDGPPRDRRLRHLPGLGLVLSPLSLHRRDDAPFDPGITKAWLPVDTYIGGNEHAVLHLLYSRFITMALHDLGHLDFEEPFTRFRAHGLIVKDGAKMSKSRGNVVVPDPIIEEYGADTFRLYLMFLGPFEEGGDYRDAGIAGPWGFLKRLWDTVVPVEALSNEAPDPAVERKLHQTIEQVTRQLPELGYNTSIAAMMEYLNAVRAGGRQARRGEVEALVPLIAPFCPHLAEELWERLGNEGSIFSGAHWPAFDPALCIEDTVTVAVQVNGKVRATLELPRGSSEDEALAAARAEENVTRFLDGTELRRIIYVQDRLLNLVAS